MLLLDAFPDLDVLVVGDAILDAYVDDPAPRVAREAPVPVVTVAERAEAPGGGANTAANVAALGGRARLVSAVGADAEGDRLLALLAGAGVEVGGVVRAPGRRTLHKQRLLAGGEMVARLDEGSQEPLDAAADAAVARALAAGLEGADAVIVADYGTGAVTRRVRRALAERAPGLLLADARDLRPYRGVGANAVTPNFDEALALLGVDPRRVDDDRIAFLRGAGERLLDRAGAALVAATVDAEGCVLLERGRAARHCARPAGTVRSTTGAGDTFVAALALALAAGARPAAAAELACAAASIVVGKPGTVPCAACELRAALTDDVTTAAAA